MVDKMGNYCFRTNPSAMLDELKISSKRSEVKPNVSETGSSEQNKGGPLDNALKDGGDGAEAVHSDAPVSHRTWNSGQVNQKTFLEVEQEEANSLQLGNGCTNQRLSSEGDTPLKQPFNQADHVSADHFHEAKKGADRCLESPRPEPLDRCPSTLLVCELQQGNSLESSGLQTKAPFESVAEQVALTDVHETAMEDPQSMRQDRKLRSSNRRRRDADLHNVENEVKTGEKMAQTSQDGKASSSAARPDISKPEVENTPCESSEVAHTPPAGDVASGEKDKSKMDVHMEQLEQEAQQDRPVQSLAKGPRLSANQSHPLLSDASGEPVKALEGIGPVEDESGEEDLYRGAEEIKEARDRRSRTGAQEQFPAPLLGDQCSVAPGVGLLSYSQREWRGNTVKSTLIRKGYEVVAQSFQSLRRVRGDNYCALRATLFQVLSHDYPPPNWLLHHDITQWPDEMLEMQEVLGCWRFPLEMRKGGVVVSPCELLKHYLDLLKKRWQEQALCNSAQERQRLCEQIFRGGEEEYGLLEALKFLMLHTAVDLHQRMQRGDSVPVFCWLLFARDASDCPRSFLTNYLSNVGFTGGLEQVEMFLLGYTLQRTIQVYRLYKASTEEFFTYYPDDHKEDWPCICLVTEDDRHYNIPVGEVQELQAEGAGRVGATLLQRRGAV